MPLTEKDKMLSGQPYRPGDPVNQWRELNHNPRWL